MTVNQKMEKALAEVLEQKENVHLNPTREDVIRWSVERGSAVKTKYGCLATWNPGASTGRSPADTFIVDTPEVHDIVDWKSKSNQPLSEDTFYKLYDKAIEILKGKEEVFVTDRSIGADTHYFYWSRYTLCLAGTYHYAPSLGKFIYLQYVSRNS